MRPVSDSYNPFAPVRNVGIGIKFGVVDMSAKPGATPSSNVALADSLKRLGQTIDDVKAVTEKYASMEPSLWRLDGSFAVLPDDLTGVETGFWTSSVSDANGKFALRSGESWLEQCYPYVKYTFSGPVSTIGWSLYFDDKTGQYPTSILIRVYDQNGKQMAQTTVEGTGTTLYIPYQIADYYAVRFEFISTSEPQRRVRLLEVDFGLSEIMNANTIGKATFTYGVDLTANSIPSREITFTFDNSDKKYNLLDPEGIYEYLQDGQYIEGTLIIGGEAVYMGSFYFTSASAESNVMVPRIRANDVIYELDSEVFRGGSNTTVSFGAAVEQVIARSDVKVHFGDGVADRPVVLAVERDTSRREALRMLAQAAMCAVWVDREEVVHFEDLTLSADPVDELTGNELYNYNGVSVSEKVDMVELVVENPFLGEDSEVIYTAGSGRKIVTVENPCVAPEAGDAVAAWLLARYNRRKVYSVRNRCNPAVEIGDTIRIHDFYGNAGDAIVTSIEIEYDGALSAVTGGVGVG